MAVSTIKYSSKLQDDVNLFLKSFKVQKDSLREEINVQLDPETPKGELPEWRRRDYLEEEYYLINDALLRFVISQRKDGAIEYSFRSTV